MLKRHIRRHARHAVRRMATALTGISGMPAMQFMPSMRPNQEPLGGPVTTTPGPRDDNPFSRLWNETNNKSWSQLNGDDWATAAEVAAIIYTGGAAWAAHADRSGGATNAAGDEVRRRYGNAGEWVLEEAARVPDANSNVPLDFGAIP